MHRTALVVDDSKSARFALRRYLEGHAFRVDTADSAQQAYLALQQQRPDLIFLDHIMPGIDGFEALRQLKQDPETAAIPVIICSSNEGEAFVSEAREQGAVDVLPKPPTPELLQRVLASVEQQASEQAIAQSLAAALPADDAANAEPAPPAADYSAELAELRDLLRATEARLPPSEQLAQLEARIGELERRIDHELVALRGQLTRDIEEVTQRVLGQVSDALLRALGRS